MVTEIFSPFVIGAALAFILNVPMHGFEKLLEKMDKKKKLREFSGGEKTKIGLIKLFLAKPDILLLDEPTNNLDMKTVEWLEEYIKGYEKAVVLVSHDRFFLDRVVDVVYELSDTGLTRYAGNYTKYKEERIKAQNIAIKEYENQQKEIKRLEELIENGNHKIMGLMRAIKEMLREINEEIIEETLDSIRNLNDHLNLARIERERNNLEKNFNKTNEEIQGNLTFEEAMNIAEEIELGKKIV